VFESLLYGHPLVRIEYKHFLEDVDRVWVFGGFKEFVEILTLALWKIHQKLFIASVVDLLNKVLFGVPNKVRYH
jgi:hypothetical protein